MSIDKGRELFPEKSAKIHGNLDANDIINVLSSEYNAVYYCNEDTHDYVIIFQQDFVRAELDRMQTIFPKYENAFRYYIDILVHHDDRVRMERELSYIPALLAHQKSARIEFRRLYGNRYLYTEMHCVKIGSADDPLHAFVVGFAENDSAYRNSIEQQKQLEYIVEERTAELRSKNKALNRINEDIIELLGTITEARDAESGEHIRRVKGFVSILARQMMDDWPEYNLTGDIIELMTSASALHDIGKISIPDAILLKPGRLTPEESAVMKTHCVKGCELLKLAPEDWSASYKKLSMDICRYHHERYDGNGYPDGLVGEEIPIAAQIVSIADCFDALISERVYRNAYKMDAAFDMIQNGECGVFSEKILSSFKSCRRAIFAHAADTFSLFRSSMPAGLSTVSLSWVRILFVDDNDMNREMGAEILEAAGAEVVSASSGREAIDIFRNSTEGAFDAILMDVIMPEMDGIEATAAIRALDRNDAKTVSIIALTSLTSEDNLNRCMEAGMDSFITKPIAISSLTKVLYECLQSHIEAFGSAVQQADREASQRIDMALQRAFFLTGITAEYSFICYVNGNTNEVSGFRFSDEFKAIFDNINPHLPSHRRFDRFFRMLIPPRDFQNFLKDVDRTKVTTFLQTNSSYHAVVPMVVDGTERLYRLRITADEDRFGCFFVSLQNIDAETQAELRTRELISILADSYTLIDYIDFEKDSFTRYQTSKGENESPVLSGFYSKESMQYISTDVHPADRDRLLSFMDPENVRELLRSHKSVTTRYRSIRSGSPRHFELQFVNAKDSSDARFAILTLSDVDDLTRAEIEASERLAETKKQLAEAERRANRDALTGVKSPAAYTDFIAVLSKRVYQEPDLRFAIVGCDINDLKTVNDTFGHDNGDRYIKNSCALICGTFMHSPVFRVGGDEFAVILLGSDYENREALVKVLEEKIALAELQDDFSKGRASLAFGIAEYQPGIDTSVADVIKRADEEMYKNKRLLKDR